MTYNMSESLVRQRLRDNKDRAYCADCMAKDLGRNPAELKTAIEALALRQNFMLGACGCGATGLIYRW